MPKAGLVLEGGGMRGVYTAGVLDYFDEKGLFFRYIVGVSAGACNAVSYISHQRGRSFETNYRFCRDKRYINPLGFFETGEVFGMDFMFGELTEKLLPLDYDAFASAGCENHAVVTNLQTGAAEYPLVRDMHTDSDYVRASSSLPLFARVVTIDDKKYLDGGVADSIPIEFSVKSGNEVHVIILTRQKGYVKKKSRLTRAFTASFKEYPNFIKALENRHSNYNASVKYAQMLEAEGKAIIIRPKKPVKIGKFEHNPERLRALYQQGYEDAREAYEKITALVGGCENITIKNTKATIG